MNVKEYIPIGCIYRLSYKGIPFYIGFTTYPYKRYKAHLNLTCTPTAGIIRNIRDNGDLPELEILHLAHNKDKAYWIGMECYYIRIHINSNQWLCNNEYITYGEKRAMPFIINGCTKYPQCKTAKIKNYVQEQIIKHEQRNK